MMTGGTPSWLRTPPQIIISSSNVYQEWAGHVAPQQWRWAGSGGEGRECRHLQVELGVECRYDNSWMNRWQVPHGFVVPVLNL